MRKARLYLPNDGIPPGCAATLSPKGSPCSPWPLRSHTHTSSVCCGQGRDSSRFRCAFGRAAFFSLSFESFKQSLGRVGELASRAGLCEAAV